MYFNTTRNSQQNAEHVTVFFISDIINYSIENIVHTLQPSLNGSAGIQHKLHTPTLEQSSSASRYVWGEGTSSGTGQLITTFGYYKGIIVSLKPIKKDHLQITREILLEFNDVSYQNIYFSLLLRFS